ncbi:MAG: arginine decarboxylase [Bacteroidales bacterium]|nr:arginine decarboxylase [Bacteroidales bacterium]
MNSLYIDFIRQNYDFPQEDFRLNQENNLLFHEIDLMQLVKEYDTPLRFTYLPAISKNINRAKLWFKNAMQKHGYPAKYHYAYCTKSAHFKHVLNEVLKNNTHIETSSAFDINIVQNLIKEGKINHNTYIICNGFKRNQYILNIQELINSGHKKCIPVIDNFKELELLQSGIKPDFEIGIRIAAEEEPNFEFYTSRLGIGYRDIVPFYLSKVKNNKQVRLKMLHFFINSGIKDNVHYWNELDKCLNVYIELKKECPVLNSLNIGGGFPIKDTLAFDYDYQYIVDEIIYRIKNACDIGGVEYPDIFTEFGSFTVGEAGGIIYKVLYQKQQNDREKWLMINSSFITTLPDSWAIKKRFVLLPLNRWNMHYERVLLGGLTCDSDDYYNMERHIDGVYLPKYQENKPLYIGFFNTGAYQESIGGYGGLQHCLIPQPRHIIIDKDKNGNLNTRIFREAQSQDDFMKILGY